MESKRIEWIDIAKGIGMLLVIMGHSVGFGSFLHNLIFAFHMPLFFCFRGLYFMNASLALCSKKRLKHY